MSENIELKLDNSLDTKKLDTTLGTSEKKVSEEEIESSLNYNNLEPAEKAAIDEFISKVDVTDTTMILQYGSTAQNKISKFSDSVLDNVKTKETGEVGDLLSELVVQIKDFDSDIPTGEERGGIFGIFNSFKKQVEKLISKYDKVENNIEKIEKQLENHKLQMLKDINIFEYYYNYLLHLYPHIFQLESKLNLLIFLDNQPQVLY